MENPTFHLGTMLLDLRIPDANSLKSKRQVIKSIKDRIHSKFNVSVSELEDLDKWQRVVCGVAIIGNDKPHLDGCLQKILELVRTSAGAELIDYKIEFL